MTETSVTLAEETALRVRQLKVKFNDFETENKMSDSYFNELDEEMEEGRVSLEKLEKRVTVLETDLPELFEERVATLKAGLDSELRTKGLLEKNLYKLTNRVSEIQVELEKTELLEERIATLKTENAELRMYLNLVVDAVNNITRVWNEACSNNEQVDEAIDNEPPDEVKTVDDDDEPTMEDNEPTQPTLRQVYDMYQSQPPDEEGWQEMTKAIEAAEEYEGRLQKQQELPTRVNGLTQDEWNDLLRI